MVWIVSFVALITLIFMRMPSLTRLKATTIFFGGTCDQLYWELVKWSARWFLARQSPCSKQKQKQEQMKKHSNSVVILTFSVCCKRLEQMTFWFLFYLNYNLRCARHPIDVWCFVHKTVHWCKHPFRCHNKKATFSIPNTVYSIAWQCTRFDGAQSDHVHWSRIARSHSDFGKRFNQMILMRSMWHIHLKVSS